MLEAAIVLEVVLGRRGEAVAITALLLFNALVSFAQEHRAQRALVLLRQRLTVQARVRHDGGWRLGTSSISASATSFRPTCGWPTASSWWTSHP
jgi:magnesium-transporting ATPase (P-type)